MDTITNSSVADPEPLLSSPSPSKIKFKQRIGPSRTSGKKQYAIFDPNKFDLLQFARLVNAPDPTDHYDEHNVGLKVCEGEKALAGAVLREAVDTILRRGYSAGGSGHCCHRRESDYQDALEWLFGGEDPDWFYSFESICSILGYDATWFKTLLARALKHSRVGRGRDRGRRYAPRRKPVYAVG